MIEVLETTRDRPRWISVWEATGHEPFAHPGYCEAVAADGESPLALIVHHDEGLALVPLILRPGPSGKARDCISPYGFGGPFIAGEPDVPAVLVQVQRWLASESIASAFLRLSVGTPIQPGHTTPGCLVKATSETVVVDLTRDEQEQWRHYAHKVRKNVNKAQRSGCRVVIDPSFVDVAGFREVYLDTMRRRTAAPWFQLSEEFFIKIRSELPDHLVAFSVVDNDSRTVSAELVLQSDARLYSFLGGTLSDAFHLAPNDLLKHAVISYGRDTGRGEYVLGGGFKPQDGIFRYKAAFDPDGVRPYLTARIVGDVRAFCAAAGLDSVEQAYESTEADFFPPFRAAATPAVGVEEPS